MVNELQSLKGKTKPNFYQIIKNSYNEMNIRNQSEDCYFEDDAFSKNAEVGKFCQGVLFLGKFLKTRSKVKSMNIFFLICIILLKKLR